MLSSDALSAVKKCLRGGLWMSTSFSGADFVSTGLGYLQVGLQRCFDLTSLQDGGGGLHVFHTCDIDESARKVLLSHLGPSRSSHVFGDVCSRLEPRARLRAETLANNALLEADQGLERSPAEFLKANDALFADVWSIISAAELREKSFCYRHNRDCPIWDISADVSASGGTVCHASGSCCQSHSILGSRRGFLGP
mmetsp:Transcript_141795/g.453360  ORF Transcript_141795/g.453360 Transcript_141795/m.453360 type:complete len:196 (-) Transcript_141795:116-703(-)